MPVLSIWSPEGGILGIVAPLALATAAGTALVIDLDRHGPAYPGEATLARLVEEGPSLRDLRPDRSGVAVLRNGGVGRAESKEVVEALIAGWPAVVIRLAPGPDRPKGPGVVPVRPLVPGGVIRFDGNPAVYQRCGWRLRPAGPGPVLPRPRSLTMRTLLVGRRPVADRWIRAWRQVWDAAWI